MTSLAWVVSAIDSDPSSRANSRSAARRGRFGGPRGRPAHPPATNLGVRPSYARYATLDPHPVPAVYCRSRNNLSRWGAAGLKGSESRKAGVPLSDRLDAIDWKIL